MSPRSGLRTCPGDARALFSCGVLLLAAIALVVSGLSIASGPWALVGYAMAAAGLALAVAGEKHQAAEDAFWGLVFLAGLAWVAGSLLRAVLQACGLFLL